MQDWFPYNQGANTFWYPNALGVLQWHVVKGRLSRLGKEGHMLVQRRIIDFWRPADIISYTTEGELAADPNAHDHELWGLL